MVDHGSAVPAYLQVAYILRDRIISGEYKNGQRLPSADYLHEQFDIAPNTGLKSLRWLRDNGYAVMSHGLGTFASYHGSRG